MKAGYYANYAWKLPILVSGALSKDSVIRVGVREGIKPCRRQPLIAEPASGVTLRAENFKADAADCVTSLGDDGKVYLVPCTHEMDDTGYTCKKCNTQFDARVGDSAYYQTLTKAFRCSQRQHRDAAAECDAHRKLLFCIHLLSDAGSEWQNCQQRE